MRSFAHNRLVLITLGVLLQFGLLPSGGSCGWEMGAGASCCCSGEATPAPLEPVECDEAPAAESCCHPAAVGGPQQPRGGEPEDGDGPREPGCHCSAPDSLPPDAPAELPPAESDTAALDLPPRLLEGVSPAASSRDVWPPGHLPRPASGHPLQLRLQVFLI